MRTKDPALSFSNPRILCAVYFGLLSVAGTILIDSLLSSIGLDEIIPLYQAVPLAMIVTVCFAAMFGESIVHCKKPYKRKVFWLGFAMVIASIPIFDLGLLFLMQNGNPILFEAAKLKHLVLLYLIILAYSYVLFGILLAIASGFAALYLRHQLVYDILHTYDNHKRRRTYGTHKKILHHKVRIAHH